MNAIARFLGFGGRNHVVERSIVPTDNSMDISSENLHHRYKEFILSDIDEDIVYNNCPSINENYDNNSNFNEDYEYDESPMGYRMDQNDYDNGYYSDNNCYDHYSDNDYYDNNRNIAINNNNTGYYSNLRLDDDDEEEEEEHHHLKVNESDKRKRSSSPRNNAISEDTIVELISKN